MPPCRAPFPRRVSLEYDHSGTDWIRGTADTELMDGCYGACVGTKPPISRMVTPSLYLRATT